MAFALGLLFCVPGALLMLFLSRWRAPAHERLPEDAAVDGATDVVPYVAP
jgi:hypothetical protein